jgi:hypothetical protein
MGNELAFVCLGCLFKSNMRFLCSVILVVILVQIELKPQRELRNGGVLQGSHTVYEVTSLVREDISMMELHNFLRVLCSTICLYEFIEWYISRSPWSSPVKGQGQLDINISLC